MDVDFTINTLLDLHGEVIYQENGYWVKIESWQVSTSTHIPHGIRYNLTLHDKDGNRVLGFDNAHAVTLPNKFMYAGRIIPYDHQHRHISDKGIPYEFKNAAQLLEDFFTEVDEFLKEIRK